LLEVALVPALFAIVERGYMVHCHPNRIFAALFASHSLSAVAAEIIDLFDYFLAFDADN